MVDLAGIALIRDAHLLLDDITWRVRDGEHWAVVGANGCGKTTLMKIVSGWQFPSRGIARVLGCQFGTCEMAALRRRIGWVSHALETSLRHRLKAVGVVLTGKDATLGITRDPDPAVLEDAYRHLEIVGLGSCSERPFGVLSQGEKMRVMIARTLIAKPELLVLDEPCVGLDPLARETFLETIEGLAASVQAPSIVYVTHHIDEITPSFKWVLAMREGRIVRSGPKPDVLTPETLAHVFGCPFRVEVEHGRFRAFPRMSPGSIWTASR